MFSRKNNTGTQLFVGKRKIVRYLISIHNKITADFSLYTYKCTDRLGGMISLTNPKHLYFVCIPQRDSSMVSNLTSPVVTYLEQVKG